MIIIISQESAQIILALERLHCVQKIAETIKSTRKHCDFHLSTKF